MRVAEIHAADSIATGRAVSGSNRNVQPCARGRPREGLSRLELITLSPTAGRSPHTAPGRARLRANAPEAVCHGR